MNRKNVLIVDDCQDNVEILRELLRDEYRLEVARSGQECLEKIRQFSPDLILLDIMMPELDGYETCRRIKASPIGGFTQVILLSGKATSHDRLEGYRAGADDYVAKPFDHDELLAKIRVQFRLRDTLAQLWSANARIQEFNTALEELVQQRTKEVIATRDVAVFALAKLADSRDQETGAHLERMRQYAWILADQLGREGPYASYVDQQFKDDIWRSSPLHDVGKVGIPDAILLKPGRLTPQEYEIMKRHAALGASALKEASQQSACGGFLEMAVAIARHHHERFDGQGYPDGLSGTAIPLAARIVAVADVFDALTTVRVYKPAFSPEVATRLIVEGSGSQFDPDVVAAFEARHSEILEVLATTHADLSPEDEVAFLAGNLG